MANFDDLLKKTLATVADGFRTAQKELYSITESLTASIKRNAGDNYALKLIPVEEDVAGTTYQILFDTDIRVMEADMLPVGAIRIPARGYPILHGTYLKHIQTFQADNELKDGAALENYFAEMLNNPDSALVQAIGFAVRTKRKK